MNGYTIWTLVVTTYLFVGLRWAGLLERAIPQYDLVLSDDEELKWQQRQARKVTRALMILGGLLMVLLCRLDVLA